MKRRRPVDHNLFGFGLLIESGQWKLLQLLNISSQIQKFDWSSLLVKQSCYEVFHLLAVFGAYSVFFHETKCHPCILCDRCLLKKFFFIKNK